jgi:prepilin-type N-terminal cleavage/methylation domain-containing protein
MKTRKFLSKRGITILEMMTAVVIIGIISALALPSFERSFQQIKFKSQAKETISVLRTARSDAITEKAPYGVHFDGNAYIITMFKDIANLPSASYDAGADSVVRVDTLSSEFVYLYATFVNSAVVFQPNGSASESGVIYLLSDAGGSVNYGVSTVLASTGKATLEQIDSY